MSITEYYVIAGFDITKYLTKKFNEWKWEQEGAIYLYNKSKGHIQIFYEPMDYSNTYLGFILAKGDQYEYKSEVFNIDFINSKLESVLNVLKDLIEIGIINNKAYDEVKYQIITFSDYV